MRARRVAGSVALAFGLGVALASWARQAEAHLVPVGVGCSTWIDVRPKKILVKYNVGFSNLLGYEQFVHADKNKDKTIDAAEEVAYLDELGARVIPLLSVVLDGKPLELKLVSHSTAGMRGPIASVGFETYFDLEASIDAGTDPHELVFRDGNYEGQEGQQLQFVIDANETDFGELSASQPEKRAPPRGYPLSPWPFEGRDLTVKFAFLPKALEKARAEEMLEPSFRGLQTTLDALSASTARDLERDLAGLAAGDVQLRVAAPARSSVIDTSPGVGGATTIGKRNPGANEMQERLEEPVSILALLLFMAWGAAHAKAPGHGKTMVAAYVLGSRGRIWDAVRLGAIVTFTHTFVVYTFGIALVYVVEKAVTEGASERVERKAIFLVSLLSGLFLVLYGLGLAWARKRALARADARAAAQGAAPAPTLPAPASGKRLSLVAPAKVEVSPQPVHEHTHGGHTHAHGGHEHAHTHEGHTHSHSHEGMDEDEHAALHAREVATDVTSLRDLVALGVSAGIVPCPAGIVLIVYSIHKHLNALKTFIYLNAFSLGLGGTLVSIGIAMVLSRRYLESALTEKRRRWLKVAPIYSALVIALIGLAAAYESFDPNFERAWTKVARVVGLAEPDGSSDRSRRQ